MRLGVAGAVYLAAAALGCAQASSPPGGEPDRIPPRVVSVRPLPFDTVQDLRAPVVIEFNERLSERLAGVQDFGDAVLVSPLTGAVRVKRGRRSLEISIAGGWRPGLVYRVVVLPLFSDLFGNQRAEPVELVFSTGGAILPTAMAGFIEDRLTGEAVIGARVEARRRADSVAYVAVSDTSGFFSLRNIPDGVYDVLAWVDQDRDREADFREAQAAEAVPLASRDTVVLPMALLPGDTTPAMLLRADVVDSLRIRLQFDDHFETGPVAGSVALFLLPDTTHVTDGSLIHSTALDSLLSRERAAADSARMAADTLEAPAEEVAQGQRVRGPPTPGRAGPPGTPRPSRELIVVLPAPMEPETAYLVEVRGVLNIHDLPGGGGSAAFTTPAPPPPPDTLGS